jgi:hypothetical protein
MSSLLSDVEWLRWQDAGRIQLPTPPACQRLLEQARKEGIAVGTLYVLSQPLIAHIAGTYDWRTGDLWCHYDAALGEAGQRDLLQGVLVLLAGIKLRCVVPQTIEQDWEQIRHASQEAFVLAERWGMQELFPEEENRRRLSRTTQDLLEHLAAAELAGHASPQIARLAHCAIVQHCRELVGWNAAQFPEALQGISPDEQANLAVLGFPRALLRACWVDKSQRREGEQASFGPLTCRFEARAGRVLRAALSQVSQSGTTQAEGERLSFVKLEDQEALEQAIGRLNHALIDDRPDLCLSLTCRLYGNAGEAEAANGYRFRRALRLYHLHLAYEARNQAGVVVTRDLWVLAGFPATRSEAVEAAWQQYLRSWFTFADVRRASFEEGVLTLWEELRDHACSRKE